MTSTFEMAMPFDAHLHLRQGEMLNSVMQYTTRQFAMAVIMPNTKPAILTADDVKRYRQEIHEASDDRYFKPLLTIQILESTTPEVIAEAHGAGAIAGKVYPDGVTTNAEGGVIDFRSLYPALTAMQDVGMVLCLHGEVPGKDVFCLDREVRFLATLSQIATDFPNLKIVLEHITTVEAVRVVGALSKNIAATITAHHLFLTLNDVIGGLLKPHNFCKPVAKRQGDRLAIVDAAMSGNPKFFLGTDSAPHPVEMKECSEGCAGVFSTPVALPLLVSLFSEHRTLDRLENFTSKFGTAFYGIPRSRRRIKLIKEQWSIPRSVGRSGILITPFMAGETLDWQTIR